MDHVTGVQSRPLTDQGKSMPGGDGAWRSRFRTSATRLLHATNAFAVMFACRTRKGQRHVMEMKKRSLFTNVAMAKSYADSLAD